MNVQLTTTGTPAQVTATIGQQLKNERDQDAGSWPTLAAVRDYVSTQIATFVDEHKAKETKEITVSVAVSVTIASGDEAAAGEPEPTTTRRKSKTK